MKQIDILIPTYNHSLTDDDYQVVFDKLMEHKELIKKFNLEELEFTGLILKHSEHNNRIHGWILSDRMKRASDGETIITSPVKMRLQSEVYSNVFIVKTQNSKYLVIG